MGRSKVLAPLVLAEDRIKSCLFVFWLMFFVAMPGFVHAFSDIVNTKHNLSASGPGEVKALTESRICIFCHTPHNASPSSPLWNKELKPINYVLYESSTLGVRQTQPSGASRLCLSCHDGTIALGAVVSEEESLATTGEITPVRPTFLDTDISDDHPVSFSYFDSLPNDQLAPEPPVNLNFYGAGLMHCSTCHDPHDNSNGKFLAADNSFSGLCIMCHMITGWEGSSMSIATNMWNGVGDDPWPHTRWANWLSVAENGCSNCHRSHGAGGPMRLMNYLEEEQNCFVCHNGNVASKDIKSQFEKSSRHNIQFTTIGVTADSHDPAESASWLSGHVECQDCHNPHAANSRTDFAPYVSGRLEQVSGLDVNGIEVDVATYEYQICFKCHADTNRVFPRIDRVMNENNMRLEFDPINPSYHPVVDMGRNPDVQSLPSSFEPTLDESSIIYCTDCHDSDESPKVGGTGPRGPHGSVYRHLLRQRYEIDDNTPESNDNYGLCYRCHDRTRLLSDASLFSGRGGGHYGHVVNIQAPCSACHDPHGVREDNLIPSDSNYTGDHEHLMNFDMLIVSPVPGRNFPFFTNGLSPRSGSCTLVCHGVRHDPVLQTDLVQGIVNSSYP